jgi:Tol biopolymer transport system component
MCVGVLAVFGLLPVGGAHATSPGRNGYIAFTIYDESSGGDSGIYLESRDGTGLKRIVRGPDVYSPVWSPDGKQIAYSSEKGIRIIRADGSPIRTVSTHGFNFNPTWSPDGKTLAFTIGRSLYKIPATGGPITRLTTAPRGCTDTEARWSPNAPLIIFGRGCPTRPYSRIFTVNANTKALHLVTRDGAIDPRDRVNSADFMPDGKRIVFTAQCWAKGMCITGNNRIVTADLNGSDRISVTHDPNCDESTGLECYPAASVKASPDGKDFLYVFGTNGPTCWNAVHAKAEYCGGFSDDAGDPDWQPVH